MNRRSFLKKLGVMVCGCLSVRAFVSSDNPKKDFYTYKKYSIDGQVTEIKEREVGWSGQQSKKRSICVFNKAIKFDEIRFSTKNRTNKW